MSDKPDDVYKKIEKRAEATKKYVAKMQDSNFAAVKEANEAIDYEFEKLDDDKVSDKYIKVISDNMRDHVRKAYHIGDKKKLKDLTEDEISQLDALVGALGSLTYTEIRDIVKGKGSDFKAEHLIGELENRTQKFAQNHYAGIAKQYITKKEHIAPALKYLDLEGKVDTEKDILAHLPSLFAYHGVGRLNDLSIPGELRLSKKVRNKKEAAKDNSAQFRPQQRRNAA